MKTKVYQICYSPETMENIPENFYVLDNLQNERADWREYWPIRKFLLNNALSENTLYGFLSPKFKNKTQLDYEAIQAFIADSYDGQDVVSFSPFWDLMAIFKNVFEQGDFFHPGLSSASQDFADKHLAGLNLLDSITHSQNTIFCNYFLATKGFWSEWLRMGELLFEAAETGGTDLACKLNALTSYGEQPLPLKVFIQERLATTCLLANPRFGCLAYSPFNLGCSVTPLNRFLSESIASDALKIAYSQTRHIVYLNRFAAIRNDIIEKCA